MNSWHGVLPSDVCGNTFMDKIGIPGREYLFLCDSTIVSGANFVVVSLREGQPFQRAPYPLPCGCRVMSSGKMEPIRKTNISRTYFNSLEPRSLQSPKEWAHLRGSRPGEDRIEVKPPAARRDDLGDIFSLLR